jgi:hypothetical protein
MTVLIPDIAEKNISPQPMTIGMRHAKTSDHEAWRVAWVSEDGEVWPHLIFVRMLIGFWDHERDFRIDIIPRRAQEVERWLGILRTAESYGGMARGGEVPFLLDKPFGWLGNKSHAENHDHYGDQDPSLRGSQREKREGRKGRGGRTWT